MYLLDINVIPLLTFQLEKNVTGPAKIGHVGSQNFTTFQTFVIHNFFFQYGMATQFSEIVHNLTGFQTHLTEPKYYISVLRYVSSNHMVYFSPHDLFSQARSQILITCIPATYSRCKLLELEHFTSACHKHNL